MYVNIYSYDNETTNKLTYLKIQNNPQDFSIQNFSDSIPVDTSFNGSTGYKSFYCHVIGHRQYYLSSFYRKYRLSTQITCRLKWPASHWVPMENGIKEINENLLCDKLLLVQK